MPADPLVRHRDQEARLDLSCPEPSQVAFAAFYADCVHEVLPITSLSTGWPSSIICGARAVASYLNHRTTTPSRPVWRHCYAVERCERRS